MFFIENPSSFHIFFLFCPKIFGVFCPIEHSCFFRTAPFLVFRLMQPHRPKNSLQQKLQESVCTTLKIT